MRIIIIIICSILLFTGVPQWLTDTRWPLLCAMLYPLFHANLFHLAVNMIAVWPLYAPQRKNKALLLLTSWFISCVVWPLAPHPVVGISNLLYASIGCLSPVLRPGYWRSPAVITFYVMTFAMVFLPFVAGWSHIAALALGIIVSLIRTKTHGT